MARGCLCDHCGREAVTHSYTFRRHQGMLVMFQHWHIGGQWCRDCAASRFWKWTPLTLFCGWLGYISVIAAPVTALINVVQFTHSRFLPKLPPGARPPELDDASLDRLANATPTIIERLKPKKANLQYVAIELAPQIGVRPAQVVAYVRALAASRSTRPSAGPQGRGFEVMPANAPPPIPVAIPVAKPVAMPPPLPTQRA